MTTLQDFQLKEYERIAEAHFKTNELISSFFRYYLVIMTIPVTVLGAIATLTFNEKTTDTLNQLVLGQNKLLGTLLFGTAVLGILMMSYIMNLRFDALLYARQVNGIRKSFFDSSELDPLAKTRLSVLPVITGIPKYWEREYFHPVIFTFALINSAYVLFATAFWNVAPASTQANSAVHLVDELKDSIGIALFGFVVGMAFHVFLYWNMAKFRETSYLKSKVIGIDIDGTIGNHTQQYCLILKKVTGVEISPEQITTIPVSRIKHLKLTRADHEIPVFHEPSYWIDMACFSGVEDYISNLRGKLGYQVFIFTDRRWPATEYLDSESRKAIQKQWMKAAYDMINEEHWLRNVWRRAQLHFKLLPPIYVITEEWLKQIRVSYDGLTNDGLQTGLRKLLGIRPRDRFKAVASGQYRAFIEDHWQNAMRLAPHCEFVFLLNQPYNEDSAIAEQSPGREPLALPGNVVRVRDWDEIYRYLALMS